MPRKLKVYQTSQGFYDLAIAAPSMKAALEAWGANNNLFQQGFAEESDDSKVIAASGGGTTGSASSNSSDSQISGATGSVPSINGLGTPDITTAEPGRPSTGTTSALDRSGASTTSGAASANSGISGTSGVSGTSGAGC